MCCRIFFHPCSCSVHLGGPLQKKAVLSGAAQRRQKQIVAALQMAWPTEQEKTSLCTSAKHASFKTTLLFGLARIPEVGRTHQEGGRSSRSRSGPGEALVERKLVRKGAVRTHAKEVRTT